MLEMVGREVEKLFIPRRVPSGYEFRFAAFEEAHSRKPPIWMSGLIGVAMSYPTPTTDWAMAPR